MTDELTQRQIDRQDFVDNAIYNLVRDLIPAEYENDEEAQLEWNIEWIAEIRENISQAIAEWGVGLTKGYSLANFPDIDKATSALEDFEMAFYPYIESEISDL